MVVVMVIRASKVEIGGILNGGKYSRESSKFLCGILCGVMMSNFLNDLCGAEFVTSYLGWFGE